MIAIACNNRFGWHLNPTQLIASIGLSVNFVGVAIVNDIAKMKKGEPVNWGSTKLFTLVFACLIIGFASYLDIELSDEEVWYIAGAAAAYITGRGIKDFLKTKNNNGGAAASGDTIPIESNK
jgi:hypothetical protein